MYFGLYIAGLSCVIFAIGTAHAIARCVFIYVFLKIPDVMENPRLDSYLMWFSGINVFQVHTEVCPFKVNLMTCSMLSITMTFCPAY